MPYPDNVPDDTFKVDEDAMAQAALKLASTDAQGQLKSFFERIENLEEAKAAIMADLKEVYAEAKGAGFLPKIIRKVVRLRKMDKAKREEEESLVDIYAHALGDL